MKPELNRSIEIARMAANVAKPVQFGSTTECGAIPRNEANGQASPGIPKPVPSQEIDESSGVSDLTRKDAPTTNSNKSFGNYVNNADGTVTDTLTGLTWMRCALGQAWDGETCVGVAQGYTWDQAMALRHDFAARDDWRLPDIDELRSIIDKSIIGKVINSQAFPKTPSVFFWSSSADSAYAMGVYFHNGASGLRARDNSRFVRLVHDGQHIARTSPSESQESDVQTDLVIEYMASKVNTYGNRVVSIEVLLERLKLLENRFNSSLSRIEDALELISKAQIRTQDAINQLTQHASDYSRALDNINVYLARSTVAAQALPDEIAQLRRELVVVLQATNTSSRIISQASVSPEPELPAQDSIAAFTVWLVEQDAIPLSELRIRLLPLDLLPSAVIDDINERALDLTGEPALVEDGDNVIVQREVLLQVITS